VLEECNDPIGRYLEYISLLNHPFYKQFKQTDFLCKEKVPFAAKCMDGAGIPT
jgi:hypothetical protein